MKGSETKLIGFMEGADKRYVIPVYQRKYSWKQENCRQLFELPHILHLVLFLCRGTVFSGGRSGPAAAAGSPGAA